MNNIFISICIPSYKNVDYLERLLNSIAIQTYTNYEVIITDDSQDNTVEEYVSRYNQINDLRYYKNTPALGTPENWNEGIRKAKGEWIKIMHDDDWFSDENSLNKFVQSLTSNLNASFFYSRYLNVEQGKIKSISRKPSAIQKILLNMFPFSLLSDNIIGPPSVVLYKKNEISFDKQIKWLVDIEFYIRFLVKQKKSVYINESLVSIGLSDQQVTKTSSRIKEVEVPEYMYFLQKHKWNVLKNVFVYDSYWRLIRNFKIKNINDLREAGYQDQINTELKKMIEFQSKFSSKLLGNGMVSKLLMSITYLYFRIRTFVKLN